MARDQWWTGIFPVRSWWHNLERDWRSVLVGALIVALSYVPEIGPSL